mmetsp:Transcript_5697/g.8050  ORF Transcript_5697/g.8050 Transcript_5697/m.8050 type:complete len:90 (-) Transcript_5697:183-452(-)
MIVPRRDMPPSLEERKGSDTFLGRASELVSKAFRVSSLLLTASNDAPATVNKPNVFGMPKGVEAEILTIPWNNWPIVRVIAKIVPPMAI